MLLYILIAITVGFGVSATFYKENRTAAAIVFLIGAILVFVYFGIRWFEKGGLPGGAAAAAKWPPVINTCPDYLVYYERKKTVSGVEVMERTCVDPLGVSRKPDVLAKWPNTAEAPGDDKYYFSLELADVKTDGEKRAKICERALDAGLTWEGVTDGFTCFETGVPGGGAGGAGAVCPGAA